MQRISSLMVAIVFLAVVNRVSGSDHVGIYAIIEKVTVAKAGTPDETVKVRGLFSLAEGRRNYKLPVYGYMFFRLKKGEELTCRKEWADLKRVAGKTQIIAFSSRYRRGTRKPNTFGGVRRLDEPPTKPDEYPLNYGVRKPSYRGSDYQPLRRLASFTRPSSPVDGTEVKKGPVTLAVNNVLEQDYPVKYFFEIKDSAGKTEASGAVKQEEKKTSWKPQLEIEPNGKYSWRAWTVIERKNSRTGKLESRKGPVATIRFRGRK